MDPDELWTFFVYFFATTRILRCSRLHAYLDDIVDDIQRVVGKMALTVVVGIVFSKYIVYCTALIQLICIISMYTSCVYCTMCWCMYGQYVKLYVFSMFLYEYYKYTHMSVLCDPMYPYSILFVYLCRCCGDASIGRFSQCAAISYMGVLYVHYFRDSGIWRCVRSFGIRSSGYHDHYLLCHRHSTLYDQFTHFCSLQLFYLFTTAIWICAVCTTRTDLWKCVIHYIGWVLHGIVSQRSQFWCTRRCCDSITKYVLVLYFVYIEMRVCIIYRWWCLCDCIRPL